MLSIGNKMKKLTLLCIAAITCLSLSACGSQTTKKSDSSSKSSSSKVVKKHKKSNKQYKFVNSNSSSSQEVRSQSASTPISQANQSNNQTQSSNNGEQVYTAHPSQGGTIYQTNGNAGSFQGDPDTIANTQNKMEQAAERIANGQQ